jgi:hypothetical protein
MLVASIVRLRLDRFNLRHGSDELDSSSSTERSSPVMLSAAKHLAADRDRPFAEFTLSVANVLRACPERSEGVTRCDCSNCQGLFFTIEPCLKGIIVPSADLSASMDIPLSGLCSKCALLRPSCPLETPETVSHYDSNLPETPETPETLETPETPETLDTLENGHRVGPNSLRPRRKTWSVSTMHVA